MSNIVQGIDSNGEPINLLLDDTGKLVIAFSASGQLIQLDDTDKMAVSLYGKGTAAGDTPIKTNATGHPIVSLGADITISEGLLKNAVNPYDILGALKTGLMVVNNAYNGASLDWIRNNASQTILASAARTAQADSADLVNYNGAGQVVIVDISLDPSTASITPSIQIKDPISGNYFTVWTAAVALAAVGTYAYLFQPGAAAGSYTQAVNIRIPRNWRFRMLVADAESMTYSVSGDDLV